LESIKLGKNKEYSLSRRGCPDREKKERQKRTDKRRKRVARFLIKGKAESLHRETLSSG